MTAVSLLRQVRTHAPDSGVEVTAIHRNADPATQGTSATYSTRRHDLVG